MIMRLKLHWEDKKSETESGNPEVDYSDSDNSRDETSQSSDKQTALFHERKFAIEIQSRGFWCFQKKSEMKLADN